MSDLGTPEREHLAQMLWDAAGQDDHGYAPTYTWQYLLERAESGEGDYAEIRDDYRRSADWCIANGMRFYPARPKTAEQAATEHEQLIAFIGQVIDSALGFKPGTRIASGVDVAIANALRLSYTITKKPTL